MILKFEIHFIILILWALHLQVSAQDDLPVAKPGCDWLCGDVSIPFPFGMNSSECYAGKWFEIECRNTSAYSNYSHTAYLKSIGVEVTSIDVKEGTVTIKHPIYRSNCGIKDSPPVNQSLEGSPFVCSQKHNKFVAAGCSIIAFLQLNGSEDSGCVSMCNKDYKVDDIGKMELKNSDCNGKSCCESSLPLYVKEYSTEIKGLKENETHQQCSYAMVVQQNPGYAPTSNYFPVDGLLKDLEVVPAVLEWEILNNLNLTLPAAYLSECYDTNITSSQYKSSGQRCSCIAGSLFSNPYVQGGCSGKYIISTLPNYYIIPITYCIKKRLLFFCMINHWASNFVTCLKVSYQNENNNSTFYKKNIIIKIFCLNLKL